MIPLVYRVQVRWKGIAGATGYEIRKDSAVIGTKGPLARTTSVKVDDRTLIEVIDLPARSLVQAVTVEQAEVP